MIQRRDVIQGVRSVVRRSWLVACGPRVTRHEQRITRRPDARRGQSILEYAVLVGAVTSALVLMSEYVRQAFNAHTNAIEEELNGATEENKR